MENTQQAMPTVEKKQRKKTSTLVIILCVLFIRPVAIYLMIRNYNISHPDSKVSGWVMGIIIVVLFLIAIVAMGASGMGG